MSKLKYLLGAVLLVSMTIPAAHAVTPTKKSVSPRLPASWAHFYKLSVNDARLDTDRDRLSNLRENRLRTNPRRKDSDRDGLNDGLEVLKYKTSPRRRDTDRDGLRDAQEIFRYKTNPRKKDTDGDGYGDAVEVKAGSNPRSKKSVPPSAAATVAPSSAATGAASAPAGPTATTPATPSPAPGGGTSAPGGPTPTPIPTPPPTPARCDRTAVNASTLSTQFSAATPGQVICLASGNYGAFRGAKKTGDVFLVPQPGATPSIDLEFDGATHVIVDGLTITGATLLNATKAITIRHSTFTGGLRFDALANADVLLDSNTHNNIMTCPSCDPARIHGSYESQTPSGVTVMNSLMDGGNADGIQTGVGMNIINNEIRNVRETGPSDPAHSDAMQLIAAPGVLVRGNWVHDDASGIVAYDGIERATIEDNVVDIPRTWGIELYSDKGSIVRHNTVVYRAIGCYSGNTPCGFIDINRKSADPAGTGTTVVDNVTTGVTLQNGSTVATRNHNMVRQSVGSGDFAGTPVFAGGAKPTSWVGFRLTAGSPGHGRASDGADVGVR
jgi:hypothetical protein